MHQNDSVLSYTTLFGLFVLTSLLLSNALVLLARYVRQVQQPPRDEDFEKLLEEKSQLETQLAQEQRALANAKASIEQLEAEIQKKIAAEGGKTGS